MSQTWTSHSPPTALPAPVAALTGQLFCDQLWDRGYEFFTGVPCSFFKNAINQVIADPRFRYVIAANEGAALGIAAGAWLGGQKPVVLIQNSGTGNLVNPLTSLSLPYGIPALIFISGRAYPDGEGDEEQHRIIGRTVRDLMLGFGVHHLDMPVDAASFGGFLDRADEIVTRGEGVVAAMVPKGAIQGSREPSPTASAYPMRRMEAIRLVAEALHGDEAVVSTTGKISRLLFSIHDRQGNFYMQGSMGHARSIALGVALSKPARRVVLLDGDGATLMHMGSLSSIGHYAPTNLVDIVIDNEAYESTGNQDTTSSTTDLAAVARACNYSTVHRCENRAALVAHLDEALEGRGPTFLHVKVDRKKDVAPPRITETYRQRETSRIFRGFMSGR